MASLREIFRPPIFADEDQTRTAYHLNAILILTAGALATLTVIMLINNGFQFRPNTLILSSLVILMAGLLVVLRRQHVRFASYTFLIATWFGLVYLAWNSEGIRDSAYVGLFILVLAAGLLLGGRSAILFAALSIVAGWFLVYNEAQGTISPILDTPLSQAGELTFVYILAGSLVYLIISDLQQSLQRIRQSNEELTASKAQLEERVNARTKDLGLANQIGQEISQLRDVESLLLRAVELVCEQFDLYQVQIYLVDEAQENLVLFASTGHAGSRLLEEEHRLPISHTSLNGRAAVIKQPVIVSDTAVNPLFRSHPLLPDTRSEMVVPLIISGRVLGVLDLQSDKTGAFSEENLPAFKAIVSQLAIALENARLFTELAEAEHEATLFKFGIDQSSSSVFLTDLNGTITYVNPAFETIYGYSADEAIGQTPRILKSGLLTADDYDDFWQKLLSKEVVAGEIVNRAKDGRLIPISGSNNPIMTPDGELVGFLAIHTDITERKQVDESLAKQARDLQTVAELATAVTTILDQKQLLQAVADLTKEHFNLYHSHIYLLDDSGANLVLAAGAGEVGRQMVAAKHVLPLDKERSLVARAARLRQNIIVNDVRTEPGFLRNAMLPGTRSEMVVPLIVGDQLLGVLDLQSDTIDHFTAQDAGIQATLATQTAVALQNARLYQQTQIALTETNTFRQIAEATGQGIGLAAMTGEIVYMNPAFIHLLGCDTLSYVQGRHITEFYRPEDADFVRSEVIPVVLTEGVWAGEIPVQQRDGTLVPTIHSVFIVRDENGQPLYLGNSVIDITERKAAEETQQKLAAELDNERRTLQAIFKNLPAGIFVAEAPSGRPLLVNDLATQILGRSLAANVNPGELTQTYGAYVYGTNQLYPMEKLPLMRAMQGEKSTVDDIEYRSETGNILLEVTGAPILDTVGKVTAVIMFFQDITNRKQIELARNRLTRELEERLEQVNALQRAMTRQGWESFLEATERPLHGFHYLEEKLQPIQTNISEVAPGIGIDLAEITETAVHPSQTMMAIPLQLHGESIGIIGARSTSGTPLNTEQQTLLAALTAQVAEALERARLFEETELGRQRLDAQAKELAVINEVAQSVSQLLEPADLLETIFKQVQRTLAADAFIVATYDPHTEMLAYPLVYDMGQRFQPPPAHPAADNPWMQVVHTGQPRLLNRTPEEVAERLADLAGAPEQRLGQRGKVSASLIFVPLFLGQQTIGALSVQSYAHAAYNERDLALLTGIANHVAVALENARLYTETQRRAEREALVNAITQKIQSTMTVENALETAVTELGRIFQAPYAAIEIALTGQQNGRSNLTHSKE